MNIEPIPNKVFGAEVHGVRLASLSDSEFSAIHRAFLEHGFLVFPRQFLSNEENIAFGERFGALEFGALPLANRIRQKDGSYGDVVPVSTQLMRTNIGNEAWHTDSTYQPISSKCAMLSAVEVPDSGGETDLADTRDAYDTLDDETRRRIEGLSAYHSTQYSQAADIANFPEAEDRIYHGEAYLRALVKVHPETGRKSLFIGRHAFAIPGLSRAESESLLADLLAHTLADERRLYRHHWEPGDTLIWDNRALLHRARPYDYSAPRVLVGTRVLGDEASELAYYPDDPSAEAGRVALSTELGLLKKEFADGTRRPRLHGRPAG